MKKFFSLVTIMVLVFFGTVHSQGWKNLGNFPDSLLKGNSGGHGVAVDPDGKVWFGFYGATDSIFVPDSGKMKTVRAIHVFNPDGTPASFSPIKSITIGGVTDYLYNSFRGMKADNNGNILYSSYDVLYRIDYKTGEGMAKVQPKVDMTLTAAAVSPVTGNVFVGPVIPGNPIKEYTTDFIYVGDVTGSSEGYSRTLEVSDDGNTVYWPGYDKNDVKVYSRATEFDPFELKDSILFGFECESLTWSPDRKLLWASSGSGLTPPNADPDYVTFWTYPTWYAWDPATNKVVYSMNWEIHSGTAVADQRPRGLAFSPDGEFAYATCFGGTTLPAIQKFQKGATTTVTNTFVFTADLSAIIGTGAGKFDPAQDSIRVMGLDWDGFGTVISGDRTMKREGTTAIYKAAMVVQKTTSDSAKWKFKAYPDARFVNSGWETSDDRWVNYGADGAVVELPAIVPAITPTVVANVFNTINFTADLSGILLSGAGGAFDPAQDSILVMGLDWDGGTNVTGNRKMEQDPFSPGVFRTSLTFQKTGDSTKWKFKAYPDARFSNGGWEAGADNWYTYGPDGTVAEINTVPRIYPLGAPLTAPLEVNFRVDLTNAINRYNSLPIPPSSLQFVGMRGGADWLGSWSSGGNWLVTDTTTGNMKVLNDNGVNGDVAAGDNIWSIKIVLPAGTAGGFYEYKYAAVYPGADTINGGSSPLDNEGGFGQNHGLFVKDGPTIFRNDVFGSFVTSVRELENIAPLGFELSQNYPNPFNPSTKIRYSVTTPGLVTLRVFDILGNEVGIIINQEQPAGVYEVDFTAINMASGVYFYKLEAGNYSSTKKMMIMK